MVIPLSLGGFVMKRVIFVAQQHFKIFMIYVAFSVILPVIGNECITAWNMHLNIALLTPWMLFESWVH